MNPFKMMHVPFDLMRTFAEFTAPRPCPRSRISPFGKVFMIAMGLYWAAGFACLLWALHRIAAGIQADARVHALEVLGDELSDEDRAIVFEGIRNELRRSF